MAGTSEIEKLERRYAENPDGRYFAPLADAYRKAGHVGRALEVVRAGLEKHPDYLSAHIVLGRCMLDKKDDEGAAQAFQRVLTLDAENIIALKSLSEIEERRGDPLRAREWLQKLLHVDPMNAEAEADLQRLGGVIAAAPTAPMEAIAIEEPASAEFSFADVVPTQEPGGLPAPEFDVTEPVAVDPAFAAPALAGIETSEFAPPAEEVPPPEAEIAPFDDALAWGTGERSSRAVSHADVERALHEQAPELAPPSKTLEPTEGPVEHVAPDHLETEEAWEEGAGDEWSGRASLQTRAISDQDIQVDRAEPSPWDATEPAAAFALPEPDEVRAGEGGGELEMPEMAPAEMEADAGGGDLPLIMPEDVTPPEEMARPSARQMAVVSEQQAAEAALAGLPLMEAPAVEAAAEPLAAEPDGPPLLTETMGDLYLKQGFRTEAADVYRRLLEQRLGDPGLLAKLASVEGPPPNLGAAALGSESARSWLRRVASARLAAPAAAPVPVTEGPTPMEQAFDEPAPAPEPAGEPTRPASDSFTLDAIFGGQGGGAAAPTPEPAPAPPQPPPTGTSFDEFFGAPPEQGTVRPETDAAPAAPPDDDINSFNSWLRGLKR